MSRNSNKPKTIYAIQCTMNGKIYVGCCTSAEERINQHFRELAAGTKTIRTGPSERGDSPWQEDYNKYGKGSFKAFIIKRNVPASGAEEEELYYILKYKANKLDYGYNIKPAPKLFPVEVVEGEPEAVFSQEQQKAR